MGGIELNDLISHLVIYIVVLLLAISAHEAGHAWMSHKFGDDTAFMLGRVTLNPVAHTDPIGTLLIPIAAFIFGAMGGLLGSIPLIGWGKPTPVNPRNWKNYKLANFMVSVAGVLANIIIAIVSFFAFKLVAMSGIFANGGFNEGIGRPIFILFETLIFLNISLFVFNLLPFPPLDGSKILENFLPSSFRLVFAALEQYGFMILIMLMYFGVIRAIMNPIFLAIQSLITSFIL